MSLHREVLTTNLFINIKNINLGLQELKNSGFLTGHGAQFIITSHSIVYLFIYGHGKNRIGPTKTIEPFEGFHVSYR